MKLRFRANSLRLRVNRREMEAIASGDRLQETVQFPGSQLIYTLEPADRDSALVSFEGNLIRIVAPASEIERWSASDAIGLYFTLETGREPLRLMVEKDLACVDGPPEERDPDAFPRSSSDSC